MGPESLPGAGAVEASPPERYFSVALVLHERRCLVVGGGPVAARKVRALLHAGAVVTVVAPEISPRIEALAIPSPATRGEGRGGSSSQALRVVRRAFEPSDLDDAFLVVTATDDPRVSQRVADEARARGILVNAADDPANCDFILPAVVQRGDIQIAITTGGRSPALARHLRERLDREVPAEYGPLADVLAAVREELRRSGARASAEAWQHAITAQVLAALRAGDTARAVEMVRESLRESIAASNPEPPPNTELPPWARGGRIGKIVLVGAGPGDPDLMTVAGQRAISEADVIVYDRLVNPAVLEAARPEARIFYAGKGRGGGPMSQEEINELLCAEARVGNMVVRLKGGDPFVFGRGGEEALAAAAAGIPFTIVPGVTAAVAVPAYAGIPVTHRGVASSFVVLTGHEDPTKPATAVDWDLLARFGGTIVLLMGVETLPAISERLVAAGMAPDTPAAVIQNGTGENQRMMQGTLADIAERARAAGVRAPATTVIGRVVELSTALAWWARPCDESVPT